MITPMTGIIGSGFLFARRKIKQLASAAKPELIATHTGNYWRGFFLLRWAWR